MHTGRRPRKAEGRDSVMTYEPRGRDGQQIARSQERGTKQILLPSIRRNQPCKTVCFRCVPRSAGGSLLQQLLAEEHGTSARENQFCPLTGTGGKFQGCERRSPELISCPIYKPDSKPISQPLPAHCICRQGD